MTELFSNLTVLTVWSFIIWLIFAGGARVVDGRSWKGYWACAVGIIFLPVALSYLLPLPGPSVGIAANLGQGPGQFPIAFLERPIEPLAASGFGQIVLTGLMVAWAMGFVWSLFLVAMNYTKLRLTARDAETVLPLDGDHDYRITSADTPPYSLGFFNPIIVLPQVLISQTDHEKIEMILAHEREHIRRRDPEVVLLFSLARCFLWFAPWVKTSSIGGTVPQK